MHGTHLPSQATNNNHQKLSNMKSKIITLILALFALTACDEEELQDVSFEEELITVDAEAQSVTVHVKANCPWFLSSDNDRAYATSTYGEGSAIVEIAVSRNATYETGHYTFTLTSENGEDKATLLILQEARIKMEFTTDGTVPAEGGNFNIYMTTNDDIRCTDTPEWVTHVTSRAVEKHTYILECKANRTGSPRHASLVFSGRKDEYVINIKQESYTPISADIKIPTTLIEGLITYKYPISISPVYADWNKLTPSLSNDGKAWIENESIHLEFPSYGTYTLSVYSEENLIHKQEIIVRPVEAVLNVEHNASVCLGQTIDLTDENCSLRFDNPSLVKLQADGTHKFIREGTLNITATNDFSGEKKRATISIERVVLQMESSRTTDGANMNHVSVLFSASGYDMGEYKFYLTENQSAISLDEQAGTANGAGYQTLYYRTSSEAVPVTDQDPLRTVLNKYTLHFITEINGKTYHIKKKF